MEQEKSHIMLIAGEASGDMHAAHLVEEIKKLDPSITFSGLGGPQMQKSGVEIYHDMTQIAVVGFVEVLKHYSEFRRIFHFILKKIKELEPQAVILVDYPGFNLCIAKALKKFNIKVIYYISPQVWAWKQKRIRTIKKCVAKMLVLFQFEKDLYAKFGIDASFIGHPLIDEIRLTIPKEEFLSSLGLEAYKTTLGLLPGSREKEVERHLPVMLEAAKLLKRDFPMTQFLLIQAPSIRGDLIHTLLKASRIPIKVIQENLYDAINACDLCLVSSGTATLETAIIGKPMVVMYKTSFLTWLLAKYFVKIPDIALVNVVAGKRIVPEYIQYEATAENLALQLKKIFQNEAKMTEIQKELRKVKETLGPGGASQRGAQEILHQISLANPISPNP